MIPQAAIMDYLSRLTPGNYVDIACAGLVLLCVGIGIARGISGELSRLLSLTFGAMAGYWIFVPGAQTMASVEFLKKNPQFASMIAFCVSLLGGLACFLLLNYILGHIIKIVLDPVWDRSLGLICGLCTAAIFLALAFTLALIVPDKSQRDVLCRDSRVGRFVAPLLNRYLHTPEKQGADPGDDATDAAVPATQRPPAVPVTQRPPAAPVAKRAPAPPPAPTPRSTVRAMPRPAPKATAALRSTRPISKPLNPRTDARLPATNGLAQAPARAATY